ncbi:MAG: outer membrane lipid asymmetry maintenance protein MlaD [Alphaproteobacteria bacterium]|nr:outer membrane lipid asymmetry maintenance protein MlaD [Alphaproteobacteria bacterium]
MQRNMIETVLGAVVLLVAAVFVWFAYTNASLRTSSGYQITAKFDRVGELKEGADVKLSGIKVGSVVRQTLDPKTYRAVVTMTIEPHVKLPADTAAEISSEGLMGGNYVLLSPGGESNMLGEGGEIAITQGAVNLIDLIGKAMFSSKDDLGGDLGSKPK